MRQRLNHKRKINLGDLAKDQFGHLILDPKDKYYGYVKRDKIYPPVEGHERYHLIESDQDHNVQITQNLNANDVLVYDLTTGRWVNKQPLELVKKDILFFVYADEEVSTGTDPGVMKSWNFVGWKYNRMVMESGGWVDIEALSMIPAFLSIGIFFNISPDNVQSPRIFIRKNIGAPEHFSIPFFAKFSATTGSNISGTVEIRIDYENIPDIIVTWYCNNLRIYGVYE